MEANVRSLRHYTMEFKKSKYAVDEFEVLSETLTGSFRGFYDDILALKQILPSKPTADLAHKINWVWQKQRVKDITARLNTRKLDLCTALAITGRYLKVSLIFKRVADVSKPARPAYPPRYFEIGF